MQARGRENAREMAARFKSQRVGFRQRLLQDARFASQVLLSRITGPTVCGLNEEGRRTWTKSADALRMGVSDRGRVRISFRRESYRRVARMSTARLEERLRKGWIAPRKAVSFSTDLFHAVRSLKHVRETHALEFAEKDELIRKVERVNAEFAVRSRSLTADQARELRRKLIVLCAELERKTSSLKKMAKAQLEGTVALLDDSQYAAACARMVAFRRRLGELRDRQIAGIDEWDFLREACLRVERDKWLVQRLEGFRYTFSNRRKARHYLESFVKPDLALVERLNALLESLRRGVKSRDELLVEIVSVGRALKAEGNGKRFAVERLREAYKSVNAKRMRRVEAILQVEEALRFIRQNKLDYMAEELEATKDSYLQLNRVVECMKRAYGFFIRENFGAAAYFAKLAREQLQKSLPR